MIEEQTPDNNENLVYYCKSCHSLRVMVNEHLAGDGWDGSYCGVCNSTDIGICHIDDWLAEEKRREQRRKEIEWYK